MRESEHFNLNLVEGSDIVNPLVQDVQNYETIDAQMFKNQNAGVQNATELKSGTVHAITRNVPDAQFITFTATSNYTAGETFTVDGIQVTALTVGGETLPTGAYVINSQVLCVLKGTLLTVYGVGTEVADNSLALNGHADTYFGTKAEVDNAMNTANAANELVNEINNSLKVVIIQTGETYKFFKYGKMRFLVLNGMQGNSFMNMNFENHKPFINTGEMCYYKTPDDNNYLARATILTNGKPSGTIILSDSNVLPLSSQSSGLLYGTLIWVVE